MIRPVVHPLEIFLKARGIPKQNLCTILKSKTGKFIHKPMVSSMLTGGTPLFTENNLVQLNNHFHLTPDEFKLFVFNQGVLVLDTEPEQKYSREDLEAIFPLLKNFPDGVTEESLLGLLRITKKENHPK